jgi:hypothetical protein
MTIDTTVSRQWASRKPEERFINLHEMGAAKRYFEATSKGVVTSSRKLAFRPTEGDALKGIEIVGGAGVPYAPSHWAFGQLCQRAGAPAGYLRSLPAPMAADCLTYGFKFNRDVEDVGLFLRKNGGPGELLAATGPNYGRVSDSMIIDQLIENFGDGINGDWRVPGEFGQRTKVTKDNTTLYASDRDMFVFLADETNRVTLPNRRDGKSGSLARGFYISNSMVGASTLTIAMYLFDYACSNRILWGVADFKKISIRHTASAPDRYLEQFVPAIEALHHASAGPIEATLKAAQAAKVETDLDTFLKARKFTGAEISGMRAAFEADEGRTLDDSRGTSLWDITTAATAYARDITWQDDRVSLERRAGALLDLVAVPA